MTLLQLSLSRRSSTGSDNQFPSITSEPSPSRQLSMNNHNNNNIETHVLRVGREIENIGERVPMSKKRISWRFVFVGSEQVHTVMLEHSRITAKKRLRLDGRRLYNSEQYCAGDWTYDFHVGKDKSTTFTVAIKDVKTTVVDHRSLDGLYELFVNGIRWDQLAERNLPASTRRSNSSVWSSALYARRVTDSEYELNCTSNAGKPQHGHALTWTFAFGVSGSIHKMELWDLEHGEFVVILDCRELTRVNHDDIDEDVWEYEYSLSNQHLLSLIVTLVDEGKKYELFIDGSPWHTIGETEFVLQPHWYPVFSRSKGVAYFRNDVTGDTQWDKPIVPRSGDRQIEPDGRTTLSQNGPSPTAGFVEELHGTSVNHQEYEIAPIQEEVNLIDFSEMSIHASPKSNHHNNNNQPADYSFDPFHANYQASMMETNQKQKQQQQHYQQQQQQPQVDLLS